MFIPDKFENLLLDALKTRVVELDRLACLTISPDRHRRYKGEASTLHDLISKIEDGGYVENYEDQD